MISLHKHTTMCNSYNYYVTITVNMPAMMSPHTALSSRKGILPTNGKDKGTIRLLH